jgi:hypothetical protein
LLCHPELVEGPFPWWFDKLTMTKLTMTRG